MGLFDFMRRRLAPQQEPAPEPFVQSAPELLPPDEYLQMRQEEEQQMERTFDLSCAEGINAIPANAQMVYHDKWLHSCTGDIDYYLRKKGFCYEDEGRAELALLCLKKSNEIRFTCKDGYRKDDYYSYVRMLARQGYIEEANIEKERIDRFFIGKEREYCASAISNLLKSARELGTDLVWLSVHRGACSECAKYQGRVFSLTGKSKRYPQIPLPFWTYGKIHPYCRHTFYPYIEGVSSGLLEEALTVQKIKKWRYTRNLIAFSNRPFVDDRPQEEIDFSIQMAAKRKAAAEQQEKLWNEMIPFEAFRGEEKRKYKWIQDNLPELCPKSYSGFRRMKVQNTKNFQRLAVAAQEKGMEI